MIKSRAKQINNKIINKFNNNSNKFKTIIDLILLIV